MFNAKKHAFTLVELIVVIVILAILATIAFLSFSSQSSSARDSARLADISNIAKGLGLQSAISGKLPMPEDKIVISVSGAIIGYQGYAGANVLNIIKLSSGGGKDPLDGKHYTYSTNLAQNRYQLLGFLEDGSNSVLSLNPGFRNTPDNASAEVPSYSGRYVITKGDLLGILLKSGSLAPIQYDYDASSFTGIDITNTSQSYVLKLSSEISIAGTGGSISQMNPTSSCKRIKDLNPASKDGKYTINPQGGEGFQVYCDMTTNGGGWTLFWSFNYNNHRLPAWDPNKTPLLTDNYYTSGGIYDYTDTSGSNSFNISLSRFNLSEGDKFNIMATIPGTCEKYIGNGYNFTTGIGQASMAVSYTSYPHTNFATYGYNISYGGGNHYWHFGTMTAGPYNYTEKQDCTLGKIGPGPSSLPQLRNTYIRF